MHCHWRIVVIFVALFASGIAAQLGQRDSQTLFSFLRRRLLGGTGAATSTAEHPTLYSPGDLVVGLDVSNFTQYVYDNRKTAVAVKFYAHWCGHCRRFTPFWKQLGKDLNDWSSVVSIAAINCADTINAAICRDNGVTFYPYLRYFPRGATADGSASWPIEAKHSVPEIRGQITKHIVNEYAQHNYDDWPNLGLIADSFSVAKYSQLWASVDENRTLAIIFERSNASVLGAELILDLNRYGSKMATRRCLGDHVLAKAFEVNTLPEIVVIERSTFEPGTTNKIYSTELRQLLKSSLVNHFNLDGSQTTTEEPSTTSATQKLVKGPSSYFASETDLLKAVWRQLRYEIPSDDGVFVGENYTALINYLETLVNYFPSSTHEAGMSQRWYAELNGASTLERSQKARSVFTDLLNYARIVGNGNLTAADWIRSFKEIEMRRGQPFPVNATWDHCGGSELKYRGYTCGLWSLFHSLTVHSYLKHGHADINTEWPLTVFESIRGWIGHFFGCKDCREHFLQMTTQELPPYELASAPHGIVTYLWRAHNRVNARLSGDVTEDPQYPKYQFPMDFLCKSCWSNDKRHYHEPNVLKFLIGYYGKIKPHVDV